MEVEEPGSSKAYAVFFASGIVFLDAYEYMIRYPRKNTRATEATGTSPTVNSISAGSRSNMNSPSVKNNSAIRRCNSALTCSAGPEKIKM